MIKGPVTRGNNVGRALRSPQVWYVLYTNFLLLLKLLAKFPWWEDHLNSVKFEPLFSLPTFQWWPPSPWWRLGRTTPPSSSLPPSSQAYYSTLLSCLGTLSLPHYGCPWSSGRLLLVPGRTYQGLRVYVKKIAEIVGKVLAKGVCVCPLHAALQNC